MPKDLSRRTRDQVEVVNEITVGSAVSISGSIPAGSNNIGDVDVLTLPDVEQSTHDSLNANANIQVGDADVSDSNPVPTSVRRSTQVLTAINTTYNNTTTTATSASFDASDYRRGLFYAQVTESGAATNIIFTLQMSHDNSNWYDYRVGPWGLYIFDDATIASYGTLLICEPFEICGSYIRIVVTANGTDASNTFTVANSYFEVID